MVRSFDLRSMLFLDEHVLTRDPHPPMDSESSYVMLTFNTNIVTAGYQGDYIPTIRATHGRTLLYALRQSKRRRPAALLLISRHSRLVLHRRIQVRWQSRVRRDRNVGQRRIGR